MGRKEFSPAETQAKMALDAAKKRLGKGWEFLSPPMKEAFVSREIIGLILTQIDSNVEKEPGLRHYRDSARAAFNMLDEGTP